jgi:hypothetical protein
MFRSLMWLTLTIFWYITLSNAGGDYFAEYERRLFDAEVLRGEVDRRLDSDLLAGFDEPKEISIHCPANPEIKIRDMTQGTEEQTSNECSVIQMTGPNFKFRFEVMCGEDDEL